jgi:hypothetical protein
MYDVAIIGGGPSGLAAAVYGASEALDEHFRFQDWYEAVPCNLFRNFELLRDDRLDAGSGGKIDRGAHLRAENAETGCAVEQRIQTRRRASSSGSTT